MKTVTFALAALLLATIAQGAGITGTVRDDAGAPLPSMTVAAYRVDDGSVAGTATTTASGTYAITLPGGQYRVLAYDPTATWATSFYSDAESFETSKILPLTSVITVSNVDFRMLRAGLATGRVTNASGAGLSKMTVAAYNASGTRRGFTTTDASGNFTLALPQGDYRIAAYDDALKYSTTFFPNAASFAAAEPVRILALVTSTMDLRLPLSATLSGVVTDRIALAPIANARVTVYDSDGNVSARTATGIDGRYSVALHPGGLRVVVDDPAGKYAATYVPNAESFSMEPQVAAAAGQAVTVDATLVIASHLTGRVTDGAGNPLAGITAAAYNADGTTRALAVSDTTGGYSIVVPAGDFRVGVFDTALVYLPRFYANQPSFAGATGVHVATQQTIGAFDFALTKGARVTGRVTTGEGFPLNSMTIAAYDGGGQQIASATSDSNGNYTLLVPPSTVKLLAFDPSLRFATAYYLRASTYDTTQALTLTEGQSLAADFAMLTAGRINGVAIAETTFAPLPNIDVIVYDANNFQKIAEATTGSGGSFRVAVPPGDYVLAAADPARRYNPLVYGGGASVHIAPLQDLGPLQFRLTAAVTPIRHRAVR